MCLTDILGERIVVDMFSYVEESWQLETYLNRKDPATITSNSKHLTGGSALPSHSNTLKYTQEAHKALFKYKSIIYMFHLVNYIWFYWKRNVMPTPMTSPRPRRSRLDPIPPNEPLDHETRHTWNPRSARDTCVPHEDSPFWTPRPKNVPKDDVHRHTPWTCIEARNMYLNSLYFLSLISPIFHVQHSFPCI